MVLYLTEGIMGKHVVHRADGCRAWSERLEEGGQDVAEAPV